MVSLENSNIRTIQCLLPITQLCHCGDRYGCVPIKLYSQK